MQLKAKSYNRHMELGFSGPATGLIWALRTQSGKKKVRNEFPGPLGPGAQKVQNGVKKSNQQLFNYLGSFSTLSWTYWAPDAERPQQLMSDSLCHFGPERPKWRPSGGQKLSQTRTLFQTAIGSTPKRNVCERGQIIDVSRSRRADALGQGLFAVADACKA